MYHICPSYTYLLVTEDNWPIYLQWIHIFFICVFLHNFFCSFPLLHFTIKRPKNCSSPLIKKNNPPEKSDQRNSDLEILTRKPKYLSHGAYQSAFLLWVSSPYPLSCPYFPVVGFPLTTGFFVVSEVLDSVFFTNNEDKYCCFWFLYCCCGFCDSGDSLEEEANTNLHLASPSSLYASLHSKTDGHNWNLHDMHLHIGIKSAWGALHLSPSKEFPLGKKCWRMRWWLVLHYFHSK